MSKSEIVIGINPCTYGLNYHDPSIAIIKDGNIIFSIEEERINGIKGSKGIFPAESIKYGMEYCKLTWDDIDGIAIGYDPLLWQDRLQLEMNAILDRRKNSEPDKNDCRHSAREIMDKIISSNLVNRYSFFKDVNNVKKLVKDKLEIDRDIPISFYEHHLAHIASSYEVSGFQDAVGIVVDGIGETATTTIWKIQNHKYREEGLFTRFDTEICIPPQKRILDFSLPELKVDGKLLSKNIELSVIGNKHICIIGKNGAGKSTLLKLIWESLKDRKDIIASYMPQDYRDIIDYSLTPTEFLQTCYDKQSYTLALTYMGTMKFTTDEMQHSIGELSGGQRAKIIFLNMVLQKANVLILDEPTRNFSPLSAPVIRQALIDFNGTIISISHDRKYLDEVADTIYVLSEDGLKLLQ